MKRSAFKPKAKKIPSDELKHYKLVASLPCAECGIEGYSQCAHSNLRHHGKGMGIKANYLYTFPLCCARLGEVGCHIRLDQLIGMSLDESEVKTIGYIEQTHKLLNII